MSLDQYIQARNGLMEKDLIAFDGTIYQVLSLPKQPVKKSALSSRQIPMRATSTQQLGQIIKGVLKERADG